MMGDVDFEWGMALSAVAEGLFGKLGKGYTPFNQGKKHVKQNPKNYLKKKRAKRRMCKKRR